MGNLDRIVISGATTLDLLLGGLTTIPNPRQQKCGCHHPNYFARLVPEIGLFSKVCQFHIRTVFGHTVFLKLRIGQFSDTPKPPIIVAECSKISDFQWIQGRIFESLENFFVFLSICRLYFIQVLSEIYMENVLQELFWAQFFEPSYRSNGTKIHLDVALFATKANNQYKRVIVILQLVI